MGERVIEDANLKKIENAYDALVAKEAYSEYKKDPKTYSLDEVRKGLGI
ncbi:MAG: DUF6290 family protein [Oscillospiraceae bacterium]|nr:DUF6290 family protein [Oscillospiraceae bacterium]